MTRIHGITTAFAFVLCGAATAPGQNLLTNPGFESGGSGWALVTDALDTVSVSAVTYPDSGAPEGTRYARIQIDTPSVENWHVQFQTPAGWEAIIGATYDMTFRARSENSSSLHFSVQDGPNNGYTYRTGFDFGLTPEWTEYSFSYVSDVEGTGALRFFLYVGSFVDVYGFDDFSLTMTPPVGIRAGAPAPAGNALRILRDADNLLVSLEGKVPEGLEAELFDLGGARLASAAGRTDGPLLLTLPRESGTYLVRARTATRSWVRKISIP